MAQIISLIASIVIAAAIFHVIGEIRRETARSLQRAGSGQPKVQHELQAEAAPAAMTPHNT